MTIKIFDDDSSIEWVDKETLKYSESGFSVLIWVDYYKVGFLTYGRVIKTSSIVNWNTKAGDSIEKINSGKKQEIIEKVQLYYKSLNTKYRVEY